jgi:serine acetyltransferase
MIDPSALSIHSTADIEADVAIGAGTAVWHPDPYRRAGRRDGVIGRDVFIDDSVTLGDMVKSRTAHYHIAASPSVTASSSVRS